MKLSLNEQRVISAVRFNARTPLAAVAAKLGLQVHTVRRCVLHLLEAQVLTPYVVVDPYALGYIDCGIFSAGSALPARTKQAFLSLLLKSPHVPWIVEYAGEFQYSFSIIAKSVAELDAILLGINEAGGHARFRQCAITRVYWNSYGERYLASKSTLPMTGYSVGGSSHIPKLDSLDWQLLREVSMPTAPSLQEIARHTGAPLSTVAYRIKVLEEQGVIRGYAYCVNAELLGMQRYYLLLSDRRKSTSSRASLLSFLKDTDRVSSATVCVGEWDYEVELHVDSPMQLADFEAVLAERFPEVSLTTLQILKVHKLQPLPGLVSAKPR